MAGASNDLATKLLNATLRNIPYVGPPVVYFGLLKSDPDAGPLDEVTGGGYTRVTIAFAEPTTNGTNMECKNNDLLVFPDATADWGTINYFGLFESANAVVPMYSGLLVDANGNPNPRTIKAGDRFEFPTSSLAVDYQQT